MTKIGPRSGGNSLNGTFFISGTGSSLQGNNVTDELRAQGIANPPTVRKNWDGSAGMGGPILRYCFWFFGNVRTIGIAQVVAGGLAPNRNLGDPTKWLYDPETGIETRFTESKMDISARLTGQLTPRNRLSFSYQPHGPLSRFDADDGGATAVACAAMTGLVRRSGPRRSRRKTGPGYQDAPVSLTQARYTATNLEPASPGRRRVALLVRHHRVRRHAAGCADGLRRRDRELEPLWTSRYFLPRAIRVG